MNTNSAAKTLLCFGDSNTYGRRPDNGGRFGVSERWTGRLQAALGDGYYVIEEGLGGRTTNLEYPEFPGRNGREYLQPCLQSHYPLDMVILMLGTNDLKTDFHRSAEQIGDAIGELLHDIATLAADPAGRPPRVIVVSPIHLKKGIEEFEPKDKYGRSSLEKSLQMADALRKVTEKHVAEFFDAARVAQAGEDYVHIDAQGHKALAEALTKLVLSG